MLNKINKEIENFIQYHFITRNHFNLDHVKINLIKLNCVYNVLTNHFIIVLEILIFKYLIAVTTKFCFNYLKIVQLA